MSLRLNSHSEVVMKPLRLAGVSALLLLCAGCKTHLATLGAPRVDPLARTRPAPPVAPLPAPKSEDSREGGFGALDDPNKRSVGNSVDQHSDAASTTADGGKSATASATAAPPTTATPVVDGTALANADSDQAAMAAADIAATDKADSNRHDNASGPNTVADPKANPSGAPEPIDGSDPSIGTPSSAQRRKLT